MLPQAPCYGGEQGNPKLKSPLHHYLKQVNKEQYSYLKKGAKPDQTSTQIEHDRTTKDCAATSLNVHRKDHRFHQWECVELLGFTSLEVNLLLHAK